MKFGVVLKSLLVCAVLSVGAYAKVSDSSKIEVTFQKEISCAQARNILRKQSFVVRCSSETLQSNTYIAVYFGTAELSVATVMEIPFVSGVVFGVHKNQISRRSTASIR